MIPAVTLRQMHYFVALAEERHFGRAAQRLHITQPPLSRQIAELESALGVSLLLREPRQVRLTAAGELALEQFREVLAAAATALQRVGRLRERLPTLRLGLLNWLALERLPELEAQLRRGGQVAGVDSHSLASHDALAELRAGRLDAALLAAPVDAPGFEAITLARLRMVALVPSGSELARRRVLALADLNRVPPFHRFRRSFHPALWDHFERQYRALGFQPQREAAAPEVIGVLTRIGAGQGCTLTPEPLAVKRFAGVARRPLKERVTMDIALLMQPTLDAGLQAALAAAARLLLPDEAEPV